MTTDPHSIAGKVALVTGGSRGIGQAIAELFARRGAEVVVCSRKQESVDAVAASIRATGGPAHAFAAHVGKLEEIERLLARLEERGPFFLTAAIAKQMARRGKGGAIVNISTTSALMAQPEIGAYCVSKAALNAMTRVFARELGPKGIRVNGISCGVIKTVMGEHTLSDPQRYADFMRISPIKRPGLPEEVAAAALFLACAASSYTSGEIL